MIKYTWFNVYCDNINAPLIVYYYYNIRDLCSISSYSYIKEKSIVIFSLPISHLIYKTAVGLSLTAILFLMYKSIY